MLRSQGRPIEILVIEDDPANARMIAEALGKSGIPHTVHTVHCERDGLAFLRQEGEFKGRPRPDLVILDIAMPECSQSCDVLSEIKNDSLNHRLPVVVLGTLDSDAAVMETYLKNANAYIAKPSDADQFAKALETLGAFWLRVVTVVPR
ncbi:MAG: response regulator [Magnetospirillum sp. WYHS-4]